MLELGEVQSGLTRAAQSVESVQIRTDGKPERAYARWVWVFVP